MNKQQRDVALHNLEPLKNELDLETPVATINLRDLLIPPSSLGATVRRRKGVEYYFDEEYILRARKSTERGSWQLPREIAAKVNCGVWAKAMAACKEGTTADEFVLQYLTTQVKGPENPSWSFIERLCTRIEKPAFERHPDNNNPRTFDHIRVEVCINSSMYASVKELIAGLKEHRKEIDELVLREIEECFDFHRYGVPVSDLRLVSLYFAADYTLEYIFEPKQKNR